MGALMEKLDAAESAFFKRELEFIKSKSYDVVYPELRSRLFIPVSGEAGPGAETITYRQFDSKGLAKLISNYGNDLPRVDVLGKEFSSPVKSLGDAFGYNIQEVRSAAMVGRPLQQRKANAAREAIERLIDELLAVGDSSANITGFLNNSNIPDQSVPVGAGGDEEWNLKLLTGTGADEVLADMNAAVARIVDVSKGAEAPDTMILPPEQYTLIFQHRIPDTNITIGKFFLESNPYIRNIDHWWRLKGAGTGGSDRMVVYKRSADKLEGQVTQEFEMFPVQEKGLEFETPCHARCGGTILYYPLSADFSDMI